MQKKLPNLFHEALEEGLDLLPIQTILPYFSNNIKKIFQLAVSPKATNARERS